MVNPKLSASDFAARLAVVTPDELQSGITAPAKDGRQQQGIVLKVSARDWEFARIVIYHQITDFDVEMAIKKFQYVIKELDAQLSV